MAHSVKRHLAVDAGEYDVEIRRFVPHYDDMLATGVELLAALAPPDARVVDLGAGTGALGGGTRQAPGSERHGPRRGRRDARRGTPAAGPV